MKFWIAAVFLGILFSCSSPQTEAPDSSTPLFEDAARQTGLDFWQFSGATGKLLMPEIMGSGAAFIDYDNDGDLDVYLIQGAPRPKPGDGDPVVPLPDGWQPGNRMFRNDLIPGGALSFTDVTEQTGVGHIGQGMGVAAGDYDNDGYTDLYVTNYETGSGANVLYHNNGDGTFTDLTSKAGVASDGWSTSTAFLDYDRDGLLDLAVVHYVEFYPRSCPGQNAVEDYCGPLFPPTVTQLFRNLGNGRFQDVTHAVGLDAKRGPGLGILTGDFDSSGWPSFLVANDAMANYLWMNTAGGSAASDHREFREAGLTHGLAYATDGHPRAGMGIADGDPYEDGGEDLVITNLLGEGFTLFARQAAGDFADFTMRTRLFRSSRAFTGFGVGFLDIENRGLEDLFAADGEVKIVPELIGEPYPYGQTNLLVRNLGKGEGFEDITDSAGPAFELAEVTRAAVFGDVNNDGGTDILITNNNGPARLLLNTVPERGHWIEVHVEGTRANRSGYGSVVEVIRNDGTSLKRWVRTDGSYLAANDPRAHFGLDDASKVERVEVHWLGGACEAWDQTAVDEIVNLREGTGKPCPASH